jgi:hypothetical protein
LIKNEGKTMKVTACVVLSVVLVTLACFDSGDNPQQLIFTVQNMKLENNEVPEWTNKIGSIVYGDSVTPPDSGWVLFPDIEALRNRIHGGYVEYSVHGWQNGREQKMASGVKDAQIFVFNFGTSDSANAMFISKIPAPTTDSVYSIPGFNKSVAFGLLVISGGTIFAHQNNIYFELSIVGYDSSEVAFSTAAQFLNEYFAKMK